MKKVAISEIKKKANELSSRNKQWHFHILTPKCQLNETDKYALILENASNVETFVCYSDEPYMNVGKELVKLLHGSDVVQEDKQDESLKPSKNVEEIVKRAKKLNEEGVRWHHHMLFPGCIFNKHKGKYAIIFEDKEKGEILESVSSNEPKSDLKHIETLFYAQKKAE